MKQVGVIYMKSRLENMTMPVIFYGEDDKEVIVTAAVSDEKRLWFIETLLTGYRYKYTLTVSQ